MIGFSLLKPAANTKSPDCQSSRGLALTHNPYLENDPQKPWKACRWRLAFDDFTRLDAARAHANALASPIQLRLHWAQVHIPTPARGVVGVGDVVSELRPFAAEFTLGCHRVAPILLVAGASG
jgi:hypothetical protein